MGPNWTKNANFGYVLKIWVLQNPLYGSCISIRNNSGENLSSIGVYFPDLLPPNLPKWVQLVHETKKHRGIQKAKSRATNTQELRLMESKTMDG